MSEQTIPYIAKHYTLGEAFSNKNGIRCYPAIDNRTQNRYILKVHHFPANSTVTEAFILSGAFANIRDVNAYYADLAKDLCRQVAILNALSQSSCFSHYIFCESATCEDGGTVVWLIAPYQTTLAVLFGKYQLNETEIIRLGISLCHALSISREAGFLYTALRPENIYISETGEFTIGDVGFIPLSSIPYAALPVRYHSIYTPQDNHDCFSHISENLDVYSVGVIMHQALLCGKLPGNITEIPSNTSKELSNIIITACSPSPSLRYKTPEEMETALKACLKAEGKE